MPKSRVVKFPCGPEKVVGFLALPSRPGRHRAIIAIHEWWGLTPWVKTQPLGRAIGEMKAAFDYLACRVDVDPKQIGSLGWSMGGALAVQLAIHEPRLAACVVNYGALPTKLADIEKINAPTLGMFGSLDRGIPPNKVRAFEKRMNAV
jgi:carboxymethylenebutenolidase